MQGFKYAIFVTKVHMLKKTGGYNSFLCATLNWIGYFLLQKERILCETGYKLLSWVLPYVVFFSDRSYKGLNTHLEAGIPPSPAARCNYQSSCDVRCRHGNRRSSPTAGRSWLVLQWWSSTLYRDLRPIGTCPLLWPIPLWNLKQSSINRLRDHSILMMENIRAFVGPLVSIFFYFWWRLSRISQPGWIAWLGCSAICTRWFWT